MQEQLEKNRPYIKKPLNAFMVFMREQRPHIDDEVKRKGNGVVNMHLAQKVGTSVACFKLPFLSMCFFQVKLFRHFLTEFTKVHKQTIHPNYITFPLVFMYVPNH